MPGKYVYGTPQGKIISCGFSATPFVRIEGGIFQLKCPVQMVRCRPGTQCKNLATGFT